MSIFFCHLSADTNHLFLHYRISKALFWHLPKHTLQGTEERKGNERREVGRDKERWRGPSPDLQEQFRLATCAQSGQYRKACYDISCLEHANIHIYINPNIQVTLLPHQDKSAPGKAYPLSNPPYYTLTPSCSHVSPPNLPQYHNIPTASRPTTPRWPGHHHTNNKTPPPATPSQSVHMHLVTSWHALCHSANPAPSQPAGPREHACRGQRAEWFERC